MKTTRLQKPKNTLEHDASKYDRIHTIKFELAELLQLEKLSIEERINFRFILRLGEYRFELANTHFIKQAIKDNAL